MDELDSKNLGRLRRIGDARSVWTSESGDFTPWLAENIDVLADAHDMTPTVVATEVRIGDFRLDIHANVGRPLFQASVQGLCVAGPTRRLAGKHPGRHPRTRVRPPAGSPHPDPFLDQGSQREGRTTAFCSITR
jgi:hypothetical protein